MNKQVEANNKWRRKNRRHANYLSCRSTARTFIRHYATNVDMMQLNNMFKNRKKDNNE